MTSAAATECASSAIAAQYEVLRRSALGEALPLEARSGLALFLRRGMWGWARALISTASSPQERITPSSAGWPVSGGHSAVVHVLATIATSIGERRAP
jgi:hypothetical protein